MTRILLIETASPKRIFEKAAQIIRAGAYPNPEISILCAEKNRDAYRELPSIGIYALGKNFKARAVRELGLNKTEFDLSFVFWTGEKRYGWLKCTGMRLRAKERYVLAGDGNEFRLTWKAIIRHAIFRARHPLPTDHYDYVTQEVEPYPSGEKESGEEILIVESAEPHYIIQSLDRLRQNPLFNKPRYTVFCRNNPEIVEKLRSHPMIREVITHSETRGSWRHLHELRRRHFDAVIVFLTGNPSYWKVKLFAFLLRGRRVLVYNEYCNCFFFNLNQWITLIASRIKGRPSVPADSKWSQSTRILVSLVLKSVALPFRFLWLLLIWLRLRIAGLRSLENSNDYSS